jgi:flagellin
MSVINTNILSLTTQNNLKSSQLSLNSAIQRLSSGMRINSAKDDAAGQAIANRFSANIRGLSQAQRNANDGISLAQTTEGALGEINTNLQRIRELAVQSANGSNSNADKASIQAEITQRLAEIDRTSAQTDFNGVKVLAADSKLSVQVGANDGETIEIDLKQIDSSSLGLGGFSVASNALPVSEAISFTNTDGTPEAVDLSSAATSLGVSADSLSLHNVQTAAGAPTATFVVKSGEDFYAASVDDATGNVVLNRADLEFTDTDNGVTTSTALANQLVKVGVDSSGAVTGFATVQGRNFGIAAGSLANGGATPTDFDYTGTDIVLSGAGATAEFAGAASNDPMALIDAALNTVDDLRGSLGAVQNRFDSVISNLGTTINNLKSSRSRIEDADYATEVSNMSRAQILQQAGTSVLAQANQTTQGVLSLLR